MTCRIVLGAGYAGLPAAGRLANQVGPGEAEITLVSASDTFLDQELVLDSAKLLFRRLGPYPPRNRRGGRKAEPVAAAS